MSLRKYRRLTSWLGLLAMWLIVCAPLVSHLARAADVDEPFAAICSLAHPGGAFAPGQGPQGPQEAQGARGVRQSQYARPGEPSGQDPRQNPRQNPAHANHAGHQDAAGDQLSDCGYCNLLADHIALPSIGPVARFVIGPAMLAAAFNPPEQFSSRSDYPSGRPRGPPASPRISS
jgi:hypothetical protein